MAVIMISKGSNAKGQEVAEAVAGALNYRCVDRKDLLKTSEKFDVPEAKLTRVLESGPSLFERLSFKKEAYVSFIRNAILENVKDDNVLYHGWAGQIFLPGVAHVLKVRIEADVNTRVMEIAKSDGISEEKAMKNLSKIDEQRTKWAKGFYGIDVKDPGQYDLMININHLSVEDAVDLIVETSKRPSFQTNPESAAKLNDLLLASRVSTVIIKKYPQSKVSCSDGEVLVTNQGNIGQTEDFKHQIEKMLAGMQGVKKVAAKIWPIVDSD